MLDELQQSLLAELGPYWPLKIVILAVVLIAGVIYCIKFSAWTSDLERRRAERNERERSKTKGEV